MRMIVMKVRTSGRLLRLWETYILPRLSNLQQMTLRPMIHLLSRRIHLSLPIIHSITSWRPVRCILPLKHTAGENSPIHLPHPLKQTLGEYTYDNRILCVILSNDSSISRPNSTAKSSGMCIY